MNPFEDHWTWIIGPNSQPVPEPDLTTWARWHHEAVILARTDEGPLIVARTEIGDVVVSTVFLAIDYNLMGGAPLLYETMVFGGPNDMYQERYSTDVAAEMGHAKICAAVRAGMDLREL